MGKLIIHRKHTIPRLDRSILTLVIILAAGSVARAQGRSMGKWLVDLGRDYPLSPQASLTTADAALTLQFMIAASRVEPDLAEAYLWQYDLHSALQHDSQAHASLAEYVKRYPEDMGARILLQSLTIDALQTAEERAEYCRKLLASPDLPGELTSDLHRRLGQYYLNRGELEQAASEARAAVKDFRFNFAARALLAEALQTPSTPRSRVEELLTLLSANPADAHSAEQLGDELTGLGLPAEAGRWYEHAARLYRLPPGGKPPTSLLIASAQALVDAGRLDAAEKLLEHLIRNEPGVVEIHLLAARIANRRQDAEAARRAIEAASNLWRKVLTQPPGRVAPAVMARMAWFFAHDDPHPAEAEKLARSVIAADKQLVVAQRALGAALRQTSRQAEAIQILTPIAEQDAWSAIELARALQSNNQAEAATNRLLAVFQHRLDGPQRDEVNRLMKDWAVPVPASQAAVDDVYDLLRTFPDDLLEYPLNPNKFLSLNLSIRPAQPIPGEPWRCTFRVRNIGSVPIYFGSNMMCRPDILCTIEAQGDLKRTSGPTIRIPLNVRLRLLPGESMETSQTIDIGPIQSSMLATPQVTHNVKVLAILSPSQVVDSEGREVWTPGIGGVAAEPLAFPRRGLRISENEVRTLLAKSRSQLVDDRLVVTELLAMLLAEHQHLTAKRLNYQARPIDPAVVQAAILARIRDQDWRVRARVAEMMRWFVLDRTAAGSAAALLSDEHWLVRGLAMRMLADHLGERVQPLLLRAAESDPDEWARDMSRILLDRLKSRAGTTTAPGG